MATHSCLENPMDRGAWWATVHGVAVSDVTEQLSIHAHFVHVSLKKKKSSSILRPRRYPETERKYKHPG